MNLADILCENYNESVPCREQNKYTFMNECFLDEYSYLRRAMPTPREIQKSSSQERPSCQFSIFQDNSSSCPRKPGVSNTMSSYSKSAADEEFLACGDRRISANCVNSTPDSKDFIPCGSQPKLDRTCKEICSYPSRYPLASISQEQRCNFQQKNANLFCDNDIVRDFKWENRIPTITTQSDVDNSFRGNSCENRVSLNNDDNLSHYVTQKLQSKDCQHNFLHSSFSSRTSSPSEHNDNIMFSFPQVSATNSILDTSLSWSNSKQPENQKSLTITSCVNGSISNRTKPKRIRRHVPHALRSEQFVQKRNTRERRRIGGVNEAFEILRQFTPVLKNDQKASKINILRYASRYIQELTLSLAMT